MGSHTFLSDLLLCSVRYWTTLLALPQYGNVSAFTQRSNRRTRGVIWQDGSVTDSHCICSSPEPELEAAAAFYIQLDVEALILTCRG